MNTGMDLWAICSDCQHKHAVHDDPSGLAQSWLDWKAKHLNHKIALVTGGGYGHWPGFKDNANVKMAYASSATYTITIASLAADTNLLAGRNGTAVSNTSNLYLDYIIAGFISLGTVSATGTIEVWMYGSLDDTPNYPDTITASDANVTLTSLTTKQMGLNMWQVIPTENSSNRKYSLRPIGMAALFNGQIPKNHGPYVVQSTGAALNATGTNHEIAYTGVYATVI